MAKMRVAHPAPEPVAELLQKIPNLAASTKETPWQAERRAKMDAYWAHYRGANYEQLAFDWDGSKLPGPGEKPQLVRGQAVPPGFIDLGQTTPLRFRRPDAPGNSTQAIVSKFTGLLFSARRHPQITCDDAETEEWLNAFAKKTKLWLNAIQIRDQGGARGTVVFGLKFFNGHPSIEILDASQCQPTWCEEDETVLKALDQRQQYAVKVKVQNREEERWFWSRRLITETYDTIWAQVPVDPEGAEPVWESFSPVSKVAHNFGFCPFVWVVNEAVLGETDGDPDCYGAYEMLDKIDALMAQAAKGTLGACDPSMILASDAEFEDIKVGTGNAIQVEKGGEGSYLEISGGGIERAQKLAQDFREQVMVTTRCQIDLWRTGAATKSTSEVELQFSSMTERADTFRERYGEGIIQLLSMALRVARREAENRVADRNGLPTLVRRTIKLPMKQVNFPDGTWEYAPRGLGRGVEIGLKWPPYFTPSLSAISQATTAATTAYQAQLIDRRNAVEFLAPYLGIEDVSATVAELETKPPEQSAVDSVLSGILGQ